MATTTNYGWTTPDDTGLVKDGASAIRTLGSAVDSTLKTQIDAQIPKSLVDAKGDLLVGTADNTVSKLTAGTNGYALIADSTQTTGLAYKNLVPDQTSNSGKFLTTNGTSTSWGDPTAASNWSLLGSASLSGATTITVSGISGKSKLMALISNGSTTQSNDLFAIRLNGDTNSNYYFTGMFIQWASTYATSITNTSNQMGGTNYIPVGMMGSSAAETVNGYVVFDGCSNTGLKTYTCAGGGQNTNSRFYWLGGYYNSTSTISSVSCVSFGTNFDSGTLYIYGSA